MRDKVEAKVFSGQPLAKPNYAISHRSKRRKRRPAGNDGWWVESVPKPGIRNPRRSITERYELTSDDDETVETV